MKLVNLTASLSVLNSLAELDQFVSKYHSQITLCLLHLDVSTKEGIDLLDNAYNAFYNSEAGREFDTTEEYTDGIRHLLYLFGTVYEKRGHANLKHITAYTQDYSLRKRLEALSIIHTVAGLTRRGFIEYFSRIVQLLSDAQYDPDDDSSDYTGFALRILHQFKTLGEGHFQKYIGKYPTELPEFQALFTRPANLDFWPLLAEYIAPDISLPQTAHSFDFSNAVPLPLEPSQAFSDLFNQVVSQPIRTDFRTPSGPLTHPLGYDGLYARRYIIEYGTADFTSSFQTYKEKLEASDRVLIYCHFNLRKHFFSSYYVYSAYFNSLRGNKLGHAEKLFFLDLGCGPLTSGIAIADLFLHLYKTPINMSYIGVDIADAMLAKAADFSKNSPELFQNSTFRFFNNFKDALSLIANTLVMYNNTIIINTSYLFASSSLKVVDLAAFVSNIRASCPQAIIHIIFQNPDNADRNKNYITWKAQLNNLEIVTQSVIPVEYRNRIGYKLSEPEFVYYELLSY